MGTTTRTLNPLHFEDLEPHRFEDMVRQLAYDFRPWSRIEATGRLGADEGIDIRGIESVEVELSPDGSEEDSTAPPAARLWVIQCKREKELGPSAVKKIVKDGVPSGGDVPHGYILAAACDFSKRARDTFHDELKSRGVQETYLWGKADLEDMLFQPKYDHLLFAYFNISLQVRRRSLRTSVRSRLATKRAAIKALGGVSDDPSYQHVLIRDPGVEQYPYAEAIPDFEAFPRWFWTKFAAHEPPDCLMFVTREHFAYVDDAGEAWDAMLDFADVPVHPEVMFSARPQDNSERERYWSFWAKEVPEKNQAILKVYRAIHYDRIVAIDVDGDRYNPGPHVLVEFDRQNGPFEPDSYSWVEFGHYHFRSRLNPTTSRRIDFFPKDKPPLSPPEEPPLSGSDNA